jgi:hypothetical protein
MALIQKCEYNNLAIKERNPRMKKKIDKTLKFDEQHLRCSEFIKSFEDYEMPTD